MSLQTSIKITIITFTFTFICQNDYIMQCVIKTIIGRTSQAKSSYSRPETHSRKLQAPSKKLGKINTLNTVFKVLTELKSPSAGKLFQIFIIRLQKKELRIPQLHGL